MSNYIESVLWGLFAAVVCIILIPFMIVGLLIGAIVFMISGLCGLVRKNAFQKMIL